MLKMMLVDHSQASQGFSRSLPVGVWETKASGGDKPGCHIRKMGAFSHEENQVTPRGSPGVVLPVDVLRCILNSKTFQAEEKQLWEAGLYVADPATPLVVSHLEPSKG